MKSSSPTVGGGSVRLVVALFAVALTPALCAQESDPAHPTQDELRTASFVFRCAGWNSLDEQIYYQLIPSEDPAEARRQDPVLVPLTIHEMTQTRTFPQKAGRAVTFYRREAVLVPPPRAEGEPAPSPEQFGFREVGSARVQPGTRRFTFLFFGQDEHGIYKVYPIADDRADSPFGAYQFHNLANAPVRGGLGGQPFICEPGRPLTLAFDSPEKRPLDFATWTGEGEDRVWLQRNTFTFNPQKHLKYFFYPMTDQNGRTRLEAKGLVEFYQPPPPAPGGGGAEEPPDDDTSSNPAEPEGSEDSVGEADLTQ